MFAAAHRPVQVGITLARAVVVAAPILAFDVLPLPGAATLTVGLAMFVLAAYFVSSSGNRLPIWEFLLMAVLSLSVLWGDDPSYTVVELRTYVPLLLATALAGSLLPGEQVLRSLRASFVLIMVISLVYVVLEARGGLALPINAQFAKNTYGSLLGIAVLLLVGTRRRSNVLLLAGLVTLIVLNRCATAWVMVPLFAAAAYSGRLIVGRLAPRVAGPLMVILIAGVGGLASLLALTEANSALGVIGKDPTLTDRTAIWAACWEQIQRAPLLGHGAFTFLNAGSDSPVSQFVWAQFRGYRPPHPHNGFLDVMGQIGVVGVVVFAILVGNALQRGLRRALRGEEGPLTAVLVIGFILAFGLTEPTYLGPWLVITFLCVAVADPRPGRWKVVYPGGRTAGSLSPGSLSPGTSQPQARPSRTLVAR